MGSEMCIRDSFHAQLAKEEGSFDFADIACAISDKMERRHPHVFGDASERNAEEQTISWEQQKSDERAAKGEKALLDDVPVGLPALTRAVKLQKRAARVGFDWTEVKDVLAKITEETQELIEAATRKSSDEIEDEFGDLLFAMANLSRHLKVDPEAALRRTNEKFKRRFSHIETTLTQSGKNLEDASLDEMENLWTQAKNIERA